MAWAPAYRTEGACPQCKAAPGRQCTTRNGTPAQFSHVGRSPGVRQRVPACVPKLPDEVLVQYGLRWERNGFVWSHSHDEPPYRAWVIIDLPNNSVCPALHCGKKGRTTYSSLDECFRAAAKNVARAPFLDLLNLRATWRLRTLEARFGHLIA